MNGFLIDTNVLSEYNRQPGDPDAGVKRWLETTDRQSQYCSVITLAEIQKGIELLAEGRRRAQLEEWLKRDLEAWFSGRVLPVDRQVAARWASLVAQGVRTGRRLPTVDSLLAATALAYDLTIITRTREISTAAAPLPSIHGMRHKQLTRSVLLIKQPASRRDAPLGDFALARNLLVPVRIARSFQNRRAVLRSEP